MGKHGIDDLVYSRAREAVYDRVKWTAAECAFRSGSLGKGEQKASQRLAEAVARSSFGAILNVPAEDREDILEISRGSDDFTAEAASILERAKRIDGVLDLNRVCDLLTTLRLVDCGITEVDCRCLKNLRFLNLSGNRIGIVRGDSLPRGLIFLELFRNEIGEVRSLSTGIPRGLLHLGLARNRLKDNSGFASLSVRKLRLLTLDLGDNEIVDLPRVLENLSGLRLMSLRLEGNPCSMCYSYSSAVFALAPKLLYLDDVERRPRSEITSTESGCLTFQCFGLVGVERPGTSQPAGCGYRVEVELPLFDPVRRLDIINAMLGREVAADAVLPFSTPRVPWSEVMTFPVVRVRVPYFAGLTELRDTFRSVVTVRVVATKSAGPDETLAEFEVELETVPWSVPFLVYEWETGCGRARPKQKTVERSPRPARIRCEVGFGVERT